MHSQTEDQLYLGTVDVDSSKIPEFKSGEHILGKLESLTRSNEVLSEVLTAPKDVMDFYKKVFPELVESNEVGRIKSEAFDIFKDSQNNVTIELDQEPISLNDRAFDVYVGGPAALCAAAIQAKSSESNNTFYIHNGNRGASNWKGSASYVHICETMPLYYWKWASGLNIVYKSVQRSLQRRLNMDAYVNAAKTEPLWYKINLNFPAVFKEPSYIKLFIRNQWKAFKDVGGLFGIDSPLRFSNRSLETARSMFTHGYTSHEILDKLQAEKDIYIKTSPRAKALHVYEEPFDKWMSKAHKLLENCVESKVFAHNSLSLQEIKDRGFSTDHIKVALEYCNDGLVAPDADKVLEDMVADNGGRVRSNLLLKKVLVKPTEDFQDATVTRAVFENTQTGELWSTNVKSLYLSLGPSMNKLKIVVPPELRSWNNVFNSGNILEKIMPIPGVSIVFLVKIDMSIVPESKVSRFRDQFSGDFKHAVRLGEKDSIIDGRPFKFITMQGTGGANFPSIHALPEIGLNVMKANVFKYLNMDEDGIEYEVISARSCARGSTFSNTYHLTSPAANMVMIYGLSGLGMTTMVSNGLLMKATLGLRSRVAKGEISEADFYNHLKSSSFESIPHYDHPNPFKLDYTPFFNKNIKVVANRFGFKRAAKKGTNSVKRFMQVQPSMLHLFKKVIRK